MSRCSNRALRTFQAAGLRILDLFCGAGGCSVGYHRAGFEVVGVDLAPQPHYPFEFHRMDALDRLGRAVAGFDGIHASPPCQGYSKLSSNFGTTGHPRLIGVVRELLLETGLPFVIENIEDARGAMIDPVTMCGTMFDPILGVKRHRLFEANWPLRPPTICRHELARPLYDVYEHGAWRKRRFVPVYGTGGGKSGHLWGEAMGIDWMTRSELKESIPPAYTEWIGGELLRYLTGTLEAVTLF